MPHKPSKRAARSVPTCGTIRPNMRHDAHGHAARPFVSRGGLPIQVNRELRRPQSQSARHHLLRGQGAGHSMGSALSRKVKFLLRGKTTIRRDAFWLWRFPNSSDMEIATPVQIDGEVEIFVSPQVKIQLRERGHVSVLGRESRHPRPEFTRCSGRRGRRATPRPRQPRKITMTSRQVPPKAFKTHPQSGCSSFA